MTKKILLTVLLVALIALTLSLAACEKPPILSDADIIEEAIEAANARIEKYRQNDAAFADTLMHFLPNSCVYDDSDGYLIYYNEKCYAFTDNLCESDKEYIFYSDLNAATEGENAIGQTIYTLGYGKPFDGGCARYTADGEKTSEIAVKSGEVYLNYATSAKKVNLRQMGWNGDDLWAYQNRFENFTTLDTLVFPEGEYPLYDAVRTDRDNVNYFGIEATIYAPDNFCGTINTTYNALWSIRKRWSVKKIIVGQTYSGLNFEMRQSFYNTEPEGVRGLEYLMQLAYCKDIRFYNCSYIVPRGLFGDDLKKYTATCFDCFSAWQDLTFDGCNFENNAYYNTGGAIAFRDVYNEGCKNLTFTNNRVLSSARDEGVALFAGWDKRFHLDNPVLGDGYIKNCLLKNNEFITLETADGLEPRTMFLTVGYQLSPVYNINYIDNTFDGYCNTYFLHYCYCYGLTFKGNTVNIRQTGNDKKMYLVYHNDSPDASDILVENNVFNLEGENFRLGSVTITSPYSDASELTFRNNVVNLPDGYAEKIIAGNATVKDNIFNINRGGSVYYRTWGEVENNVYNIKKLEKSIFEFYNADVTHDLVLKNDTFSIGVALSYMLMFNGPAIKFNGHSILFENIDFDIQKVDREKYSLCYSSDAVTDTVVPVTFKNCAFGAYDGHLTMGGKMHTLSIEN